MHRIAFCGATGTAQCELVADDAAQVSLPGGGTKRADQIVPCARASGLIAGAPNGDVSCAQCRAECSWRSAR